MFASWSSTRAAAAALAVSSLLPAQSAPAPILASDFALRAVSVGVTPGSGNTFAPVAAAGQLLFTDAAGVLYRRDAAGVVHTLIAAGNPPPGITLRGERILNVAANAAGNRIFAAMISTSRPAWVPLVTSPRGNNSGFLVIYEFAFDGVALSQDRAVISFDINTTGHTGGGLAVLDDGSVLLAVGDNGDAGEDGRGFPQDGVSHLGKIVRIDPAARTWSIVAQGVRNVQRIERVGADLRFVDIGGRISEELNEISIAALLDTTVVENFGWGRNATDNNAREGLFYIDASGFFVANAPLGEAGFVQPVAEYGREMRRFVAVSGPITRASNLLSPWTIFGDLVSGEVFVQVGNGRDVFAVAIVDAAYAASSLELLAGGRPDPRFFSFPDGSAGVLLEATGEIFRLEQIPLGAPGVRTRGVACGAASFDGSVVGPSGTPAAPGSSIEFRLTTMPSGAGRSYAMLAGVVPQAAPLDLSPIGMTGCAFGVGNPVLLDGGVLDGMGQARFVVLVAPATPLGIGFQAQAVVVEPGANALGLVTTEVVTTVIGG